VKAHVEHDVAERSHQWRMDPAWGVSPLRRDLL